MSRSSSARANRRGELPPSPEPRTGRLLGLRMVPVNDAEGHSTGRQMIAFTHGLFDMIPMLLQTT